MKSEAIQKTVLVAVVLTASGCFVDLDRDEALLQVVVSGVSAEAEAIVLEVDSGEGAYVERFDVPEAPPRTLPDISAPAGFAGVTATTIDADGLVVDGPLVDTIVLQPGANGLDLDFSKPSSSPPPGDEELATAVASVDVTAAPPAGPWSVALTVDRTSWSTALASLTAGLGGEPSALELRHVDVASRAPPSNDDGPDEFEDLWIGDVTVRLAGGEIDEVAGAFAAVDVTRTRLRTSLDVTPWASLPMDARVLLEGEVVSDDEPSVPLILSVDLEIAGRR